MIALQPPRDVFVRPSQMNWVPFSEGIDFKLLHVDPQSASWTVLFRCAKGSSFARHRHLAAGEYFMVSGVMDVRGGETAGGITARAGEYGFEPTHIVHDQTDFREESVLYFKSYGAVQFLDAEGKTLVVLTYEDMDGLARKHAPQATAAE